MELDGDYEIVFESEKQPTRCLQCGSENVDEWRGDFGAFKIKCKECGASREYRLA